MLLSPGSCALMSEGVPLSIKAATTISSVELEAALVDSVCIRLLGVLATVPNDTVSFCFGLTGKSAKSGAAACAALSQLRNPPEFALEDHSLHGCLEHPREVDLVPIKTAPSTPRKHKAAIRGLCCNTHALQNKIKKTVVGSTSLVRRVCGSAHRPFDSNLSVSIF
jgi:hypothetical protein